MADEKQPVDVLFVVPDAKESTWRLAIKHTLWAFEITNTIDIVSADTFVRLYGDMPVEEMDAALKLRCKALTNSSDISKREWKAFQPLRDKLYNYWQSKKNQEPQPSTQEGE